MPLIDSSRILNNAIVLAILAAFAFLIYSKLDREKTKSTIEGIKKLFSPKEEK